MSVFLTGDIHGDIYRLRSIPDENLTKKDVVIILGDFGVIWEKERAIRQLEVLGSKNFTVAFVDGNHENFDLIEELELPLDWNSGKVGYLPFGIIHLKRGEIYTIEGRTFGVCGGADSVDKWMRNKGTSWWPQETLTADSAQTFINNAKNKKLDFVLTHDCPQIFVGLMGVLSGVNSIEKTTETQNNLQMVYDNIECENWYFGHWHINCPIPASKCHMECLFDKIKEVV